MKTFLADLQYSARMLLAVPAVYGAAVLSLALGIGANTAIFSVVDGVLLRPLPYPEPDRLVMIWERDQRTREVNRVGELPPGLLPMSVPNFFDYRAQNRVFSGMAGMWPGDVTVAAGGHDPVRILGATVFANFFETLGVRPALGRTFLPAEEQPGRNRVVVLSHDLWAEAYGEDPHALGRKLLLEGQEHTVVGVMPPGFQFPKDVRIWYPTGFPHDFAPRNFNFIRAFGRLANGVSPASAQAALSTMARHFEQQYPNALKNRGIFIVPLREQIVGSVRPRLAVLLGVAGLVLLIACGNVSNLLLARGAARRREIAIRTALGARQGRLVRQLLTESLLLVLLGGGLGLLLAFWGLRSILRLAADQVPRVESIAIDPAVLAFTLLVSLAAGVIASLVPAFRAARPDLGQVFKEGGEHAASGARLRLGRLLVALQLAIAMVLVSGAGLLVKSFLHLMAVDPGFRPEDVLTAEITLPAVKYHDGGKNAAFFKELNHRVETLPGVRSAGFTFFLPMSGQSATVSVEAEGSPLAKDETKDVVVQAVTPGFFATLGVPLHQGRLLTDGDDAGAPPVVVLNEAAARRFWPGGNPLGRKVTFAANFGPAGRSERLPRRVVGVVGDIHHYGLDQSIEPEVYFPTYQATWRWENLVVRMAGGDPRSLVPALRRELKSLDADLAVGKVRTLDELVSDSVAKPRLTTLLMLTFAFLSLALAGVGVYGMVAYSVVQRVRELAVRMAIGAGRGQVFRLILGEGVGLGLVGLGVGLVGALGLSRFVASLLFDVSPLDPAVFGSMFLLLLVLVALASLLPARRATRVDPVEGLRYE